jgi:hypothetical protein
VGDVRKEANLVLIELAVSLVEHVLLKLHSLCSTFAAIRLWYVACYTTGSRVWVCV